MTLSEFVHLPEREREKIYEAVMDRVAEMQLAVIRSAFNKESRINSNSCNSELQIEGFAIKEK